MQSAHPDPALIEEIFHKAWESPPESRTSLLNEYCGENAALKQAVADLLKACEEVETSDAWTQPAIFAEAQSTARQEDSAELERYKLLELLGSGGMGVVYKAVRSDDAFSKLVAVKIVHSGAGNEQILKRFTQERQILAGLEHPNIARLIDGGVTSHGLPFFAMEYVDGVTIDKYLQTKKPALDETLALFRKICSAVAYAHRNLIIHRDLKPGNILVTADGEPKLLDFGIAKLIDDSAATKTEKSSMTPEYASPEQIRGTSVTTASDIYSLGVLLYEMLTGARPYRDTPGALDLARAIVEETPEPLNIRGANFDVDLETIVQKALRKEPERRYDSVDHFSDDIKRYQEGYPVTARPDTRGYRLNKFIGRNKIAVTAAVLLFAAITVGAAATWRQAQIANRRFNDVRRLANSYLFEFHDAIKTLPGSTPARQLVVKRAIEFLDGLAKERGNDVALGSELATAYDKIAEIQGGVSVASLGDIKGALSTWQRSLEIREALAAKAPNDLDLLKDLASNYSSVGAYLAYTGQLTPAIENLRKGVELGERYQAARPADPKARETLATNYLVLGDALGNPNYQNVGNINGAVELYRKSLALRQKLVQEDPANIERRAALAASYGRLAQVLQALNDNAGTVKAYRQAADISHQLAAEQPLSAETRRNAAVSDRNLALALVRNNSLTEARERGDRSMKLFEQVAHDDPKNTEARVEVAESQYSQGFIRSKSNEDAAALHFYESAAALFEAIASEHPADPPRPGLRTTYQLMSDLALKLGDTHRAITSAQRELAIDEILLRTNPQNVGAERNKALALRQIAKAQEVSGMLREALSNYRQSLAIFQGEKEKGTLAPQYASELENTPKAIARCESALAR